VKAVLAAIAVLPACALASVDADLDEGCVNRLGIAVPAVPVTGIHTIAHEFTVDDLGGLAELAKDGDPDLHFIRFKARAVAGSPANSLAGVTAAHVALTSPGLPSVIAYDCSGDCPVVGPVLEVPPATDAGAADYLATGSLTVAIDISGALPDRDWTMDVSVCVSGHLAYSLGP